MLLLATMLSGCGKSVVTENKGGSDYRICMITGSGDITDQSFNQTTYEAGRDYCKAYDIDFTYKKLVADIYDGKIQVSNDITQMPEVSVKLNVRQGTIK